MTSRHSLSCALLIASGASSGAVMSNGGGAEGSIRVWSSDDSRDLPTPRGVAGALLRFSNDRFRRKSALLIRSLQVMLCAALGCSSAVSGVGDETTTIASGAGDTEGQTPICDGSSEILLIITTHLGLPNNRTDDPAAAVTYENGIDYFYVTGACDFHVVSDQDRFEPDYTGKLTEQEVGELTADLLFEQWPEHYGLSGGFFVDDDGTAVLDRKGVLWFGAGCGPAYGDTSTCPHPLPDIAKGRVKWKAKLKEIGAPASGPMRVAAVGSDPAYEGIGEEWRPWPLQRPLADFLIDDDAPIIAGRGILVEDPHDVSALRDLRDEFRDNLEPSDSYRGMTVEHEGAHYRVYARDTAAKEDEHGLVPWLDRLQ